MTSARLLILLLTALLFAALTPANPQPKQYDLVVYGGTSAAVIAAVQAKKDGLSVVIVSPDTHLGGLTSGGLGWTDSGDKSVIGGLARNFYHRIYLHYDQDRAWRWQAKSEYGNAGQGQPAIDGSDRTMWIFEPHAAENVFEDLVKEFKIPVYRDHWLDREQGVKLQSRRIQSITTLNGATFSGKMFIDATYEGDLMAAAGVSYTVGRESNATYSETLNGNQPGRDKHQFLQNIDPYKIPGDPTSGLLPRIQHGFAGTPGEGDHRVQAYTFRVCLTQHPENRVPFPKPEGYDPTQYELLLRTLLAGSNHVFGKFDPIPNLKTDTNNHGSFSTDNIGMNYDYPEADYARRQRIIKEHETYQKGYFYFLANDPRVPAPIRERYATWGLAKDEFLDNGNWPHQLYIREARRMVSDFVVTENHLKGNLETPCSVGMGSYNMDSHNVRRYVDPDGFVRNEGDVQVGLSAPYPIDYGAIVPKQSECENLLVPVCVSASHIAFGSIRMEPVFMILGQSAAQAAKLAIDQNLPVQQVPYEQLSTNLKEQGQVLYSQPKGTPLDSLEGIVIDDDQAVLTGAWVSSTSNTPFVHRGYRQDNNQQNGPCTATYQPKTLPPGTYEVKISYPTDPNRSTQTEVTITDANGNHLVKVNQKTNQNGTVSLGNYTATTAQPIKVTITNQNADGYVIIDAVQFLPVRSHP